MFNRNIDASLGFMINGETEFSKKIGNFINQMPPKLTENLIEIYEHISKIEKTMSEKELKKNNHELCGSYKNYEYIVKPHGNLYICKNGEHGYEKEALTIEPFKPFNKNASYGKRNLGKYLTLKTVPFNGNNYKVEPIDSQDDEDVKSELVPYAMISHEDNIFLKLCNENYIVDAVRESQFIPSKRAKDYKHNVLNASVEEYMQ